MRLFVYGTLKRGQVNHLHYFGADAAVEEAHVRGRLVQLPQGYPMLIVPDADVLAIGTADYAADFARQHELSKASWGPTICRSGRCPPPGDWPLVRGQIIDLTDVENRLPDIDALEDFNSSTGTGMYLRVLLRAVEPCVPVWTYVAPASQLPAGAIHCGTEWPGR